MYIYHFLSAALISFVIYTPFLKAADPDIPQEHVHPQQEDAIPQRIKNLVKKDKQLQKLLGRYKDIEEFVTQVVDFTNSEIGRNATSEQLRVMLEIFKFLNKSHQAMLEKELSSRDQSGKLKYSKIYKAGAKGAMTTIEQQIKKLQGQAD